MALAMLMLTICLQLVSMVRQAASAETWFQRLFESKSPGQDAEANSNEHWPHKNVEHANVEPVIDPAGSSNERNEFTDEDANFDLSRRKNVSYSAVEIDALSSAVELIVRKGYAVETHTVRTTDDYVLTIHRIRYGIKLPDGQNRGHRPAVFLQHGIYGATGHWIADSPSESLAFILADAGYDVWIGNCRGNVYSRKHKKFSTDSKEFWRFSFHELAMFDLPAMINYVANQTNHKKLYYVAHSQGAMMGFIKFSDDPTWAAERIQQFHGLAPALFPYNVTCAMKYLAKANTFLRKIIGIREFKPSQTVMEVLRPFCSGRKSRATLCKGFFLLVTGYNKTHLNRERFPVYMLHGAGGASAMNMYHLAQVMNNKQLRQFDYGSRQKNKAQYDKELPPFYKTWKFALPLVVYSGLKDTLVTPSDTAGLISAFQRTIKRHYEIEWATHLDFVFGHFAAKEIYPKLLAELEEDVKRRNAEKSVKLATSLS